MEHKGYFLFSPMVEPELIFGIGLGITGIVDESMLMQKSHNPVDFFSGISHLTSFSWISQLQCSFLLQIAAAKLKAFSLFISIRY